jgi:hypothetical protein
METFVHRWGYLAKFFFWIRNVLDKIWKSKHTFYVQWHFPENRAVYEIMSKNVVEPERPQMTSQYGASIYLLDKQHYTHTRRKISNNYCFSTATMVRQRASVLRYTYIACLVTYICKNMTWPGNRCKTVAALCLVTYNYRLRYCWTSNSELIFVHLKVNRTWNTSAAPFSASSCLFHMSDWTDRQRTSCWDTRFLSLCQKRFFFNNDRWPCNLADFVSHV